MSEHQPPRSAGPEVARAPGSSAWVHDEVHWMAVAIETIALVSAIAFAWVHTS